MLLPVLALFSCPLRNKLSAVDRIKAQFLPKINLLFINVYGYLALILLILLFSYKLFGVDLGIVGWYIFLIPSFFMLITISALKNNNNKWTLYGATLSLIIMYLFLLTIFLYPRPPRIILHSVLILIPVTLIMVVIGIVIAHIKSIR